MASLPIAVKQSSGPESMAPGSNWEKVKERTNLGAVALLIILAAKYGRDINNYLFPHQQENIPPASAPASAQAQARIENSFKTPQKDIFSQATLISNSVRFSEYDPFYPDVAAQIKLGTFSFAHTAMQNGVPPDRLWQIINSQRIEPSKEGANNTASVLPLAIEVNNEPNNASGNTAHELGHTVTGYVMGPDGKAAKKIQEGSAEKIALLAVPTRKQFYYKEETKALDRIDAELKRLKKLSPNDHLVWAQARARNIYVNGDKTNHPYPERENDYEPWADFIKSLATELKMDPADLNSLFIKHFYSGTAQSNLNINKGNYESLARQSHSTFNVARHTRT